MNPATHIHCSICNADISIADIQATDPRFTDIRNTAPVIIDDINPTQGDN